MWTVLTYLILEFAFLVVSKDALLSIENEKNTLMENEVNMMLGSEIELSDSEQKANEIIMLLKYSELEFSFQNPEYFNFSKHFFEYKDTVKNYQLFKLIKKMPKGAVLHVHDTGLLSPDYVLELTYWDNLYVCFEENNVGFLFSNKIPTFTCKTRWQLLKDARYSSGNVEKFDAELRKHFTIVTDKHEEVYTNINAAWSKFQQYFITTAPLYNYKPIWEKYFYDTLKTFREDNIMYIELRSILPPLYDINGKVYDMVETAESYKKVLDEFMNDYPDFFGAKLIFAPLRLTDHATLKEHIKIAKEIKRRLPDFFAGFDLVGQEDLGFPLKEFLPQLVEASNELNYFFHAGETNWYGTDTDENIFDAIVLGTKRIGHAYALIKHPVLLEEVKKRDIAVEVNVISNNVLKLVSDIRNHPLASYLSRDLPVVISSDDPGVWEAEPLSHDFYVTFVGVASRHADLRLLKKLALNSLYYSTYPDKDKIVHEFEIRWTKFIDSIVRDKW